MSIGSTLKHVLGFVAGILIPGANNEAVTTTHSIQQEFAELYGVAATKLAESLKLDTTGMSGPDKIFYILKALIETAKTQGFKGDLKVLETVLLDLAQTAYRNSIPTIESDVIALATSLHVSPVLSVVATLVLPVIEKKVEDVAQDVLHLDQPLAA